MRWVWLAIVILPAAACSTWRWAGAPAAETGSRDELHPPPSGAPGPEVEVVLPAARPGRLAPIPLPEPTPAKLATAVFYSDLAPDVIDLSEYPLQQRFNFRLYSQACSRCHDLSRSLYAPHTNGAWLEFYLTGMRVRGRLGGRRLSKAEVQAARDFLSYDAAVRKKPGSREFEAQLEQLRRRFDALVDERMEKLQRSPPHALGR